MTLKLVVNKPSAGTILPTCRKNCELFDKLTGECGVNNKGNFDDPLFAARCGTMIYYEEKDKSVFIPGSRNNNAKIKYTLLEDEFECEIRDEEAFLDIQGDRFEAIRSSYPQAPDYPSRRKDAIWFVSSCGLWGCWIVNKSTKKLMTVSSSIKTGWAENVYKSPFPLHDHKASLSLASKMAWYVDEEGYGQYVLLGNGEVQMISSPKPKEWNK